MTATESTLPELTAPPAPDGEEHTVLNGLITENLRLTTDDVPPIALMEGEKIVRHPDDGSDVEWTFTGLRRDEDDHIVIDYRTADGETGSFTVTDPGLRLTVEVGQVLR